MAKALKLTDQTLLTAKPDIIDSEIDDEIVMMNIDTGAYFGLDDIASIIWQKMKEPIQYGDLIDSLTAEYEVERQQCIDDLQPLLQQMQSEGLITAS